MENQIRQNYRYCLLWKNCLTEKFFPCLLFQAGTKLLSNTDNISAFMRKAPRTKTSLLNKYGVNAQINENKELVLPTNNVADLNRVLEFLNEDIFRGVITDRLYRSNSKKKDNH